MAFGPGRYDEFCTIIREALDADGVIVIVLNGRDGGGFSAQLSPADSLRLPEILRGVADEIDQKGLTV